MKKILMVLESEFPSDERVEKEIESLQASGFQVTLAVYTFLSLPVKELHNNYLIYRKKISRLLYKSSAASLLLPFYFRFWIRFLENILSVEKYDIIHIHDLPLSKVGYILSMKYNLKLVCDQHEYYSNWIVRTRHYNTCMGKIIRTLASWKNYEKKYLQKADLVITVEDPLKSIYINHVQISPGKIVTLPNTPRADIFDIKNTNHSIVEKYRDHFVLFYAGSLDHLRGLDFIAECVSRLRKEIDSLLFLVVGKENRAFSIKDLVQKYDIEANVQYIGWVPLAHLSSYIATSNICLFVPKADNLEINNTVATKIYQYAAMGKPVIVSEAKMMKDFVEQNGIGYSVNYGDIERFCEAVDKLYKNPELVEEIKTRAVKIASQFTWEKTAVPFVRYYSQLNP